jgi:hypothetical protein
MTMVKKPTFAVGLRYRKLADFDRFLFGFQKNLPVGSEF